MTNCHLPRLGRSLVSLLLLPALLLLSPICVTPASSQVASPNRVESGVLQIGRIQSDAIRESSGLAPCRVAPDLFWTHNDKGSRPVLFAINRQGQSVAQIAITGAAIEDWEDLASDRQGHLYLADTGNNEGQRTSVAVHRVPEPDPQSAPATLAVDRSWTLTFPSDPRDFESLFVYNNSGYLISKVTNDRQAEIFKFPLGDSAEPITLKFLTLLPVTSPVSGADLSADGTLLGLVCKSGAYVFPFDPDNDRVGILRSHRTKYKFDGIEGCCFVPDGLLATAETREIFLFDEAPYRPSPTQP